MIEAILVLGAVIFVIILFAVLGFSKLIFKCAPNEVLIFSGPRRRLGERILNYKIVKGGMRIRVPLLERVDSMDLTNMVIDISASNAYSKGGIPLTVQGVANVKVAGHEPLLNNAIERFLGKNRTEIANIAKATLEGSLRGILATMTPEQVNEDKIMFAERLVQEVEQDMTSLGLIVDTMKIQNVQDEVRYLDSIGRKRNAEVLSKARIAEAIAHADSLVRQAENLEQEVRAQVDAQIAVAKADAQKRLSEVTTRRDALIAEELASVAALVAKAKAEIDVQNAKVEQVRSQLEADVIQPAKASMDAAEEAAKAEVAKIIEEGRAKAEALRTITSSMASSGANGRQILLVQKLDKIIEALTDVIAETKIEKLTVIDSKTAGLGSGGDFAVKALSTLEQIKQVSGIDLLDTLGISKPAHVQESVDKEDASDLYQVEPDVDSQTEPPAGVKIKFNPKSRS